MNYLANETKERMITRRRIANSRIVFQVFIILMSFGQCRMQLQNSTELTRILENMMETYDKRILPTKNGDPALVMLQMYIGDMVPVEAIHMHYSIDLYLREFWYDYRLKLPLNNSEQFPLAGSFVKDIWTPDIYFPSGKKGKLHDITRPNSLIRILPNGEIRSSQRVSITSFCPMHLQNFPFDQQVCEFLLEPYSYNNKQCRLEWNYAGGGPIFKPNDLMMFEFTLHKIEIRNKTADYGLFGMYDRLLVRFHFRRNVNYYLLQNYFPTFLVVVLSWVGFWIDYRSTPARVALGITTVLTITTLANSIRATLPPVSYSKSIDYYLLACFLFVFAALIEYASVGITDIKWRKAFKRSKKKGREEKVKKRKNDVVDNDVKRIERTESGIGHMGNSVPPRVSASPLFLSTLSLQRSGRSRLSGCRDNQSFESEPPPRSRSASIKTTDEDTSDVDDNIKTGNNNEEKNNEATEKRPAYSFASVVRTMGFAKKLAAKHRHGNEVHIIDKLSRYLFPIVFGVFNILYFAIVVTQSTVPH